ncbi:hypothetical protein [Halalkalibacter wakoensis]|uniref:hypothetical protein n=1 Tax=Halalkalibacter wakoensis TaxID=127891 RepID=UPI000554B8DD|nr:hypothetical protein [Halalkalibacter wakoensis]
MADKLKAIPSFLEQSNRLFSKREKEQRFRLQQRTKVVPRRNTHSKTIESSAIREPNSIKIERTNEKKANSGEPELTHSIDNEDTQQGCQ